MLDDSFVQTVTSFIGKLDQQNTPAIRAVAADHEIMEVVCSWFIMCEGEAIYQKYSDLPESLDEAWGDLVIDYAKLGSGLMIDEVAMMVIISKLRNAGAIFPNGVINRYLNVVCVEHQNAFVKEIKGKIKNAEHKQSD